MKNYLYALATDQRNGIFDAIIKIFLWIFSILYFGLVLARSILYKLGILTSRKLVEPVICVGNITVGGVGKTPLVLMLSKIFLQRKMSIAILTRGYKSENNETEGRSNDESRLLKSELPDVPILIGSKRYETAMEYLKNQRADMFLMDDGFQHLPLKRDLDILAIDATNPFGNGHLLPRGILREPKSALKRAGVFVLTKTDLGADNLVQLRSLLKMINPKAPIIESIHRPKIFVDVRTAQEYPLDYFRDHKFCLVSGIGNPRAFEQTLKALGGMVSRHFIFEDHMVYDARATQLINEFCTQKNIKNVVTTQKDAIKLKENMSQFSDAVKIAYLKIDCEIVKGKDILIERIDHLLRR